MRNSKGLSCLPNDSWSQIIAQPVFSKCLHRTKFLAQSVCQTLGVEAKAALNFWQSALRKDVESNWNFVWIGCLGHMVASGPEVCSTDVEATTTLWQDILHQRVNVLVSSDVL